MTDAARDVDRGEQLRVGEVDLWVDVVGDGHDTVVLLAGADTPGFHWSPGFVARWSAPDSVWCASITVIVAGRRGSDPRLVISSTILLLISSACSTFWPWTLRISSAARWAG